MEIKAEVDLTPAQMAALFWEMDSDKQADFFITLGLLTNDKYERASYKADMQWLYIRNALRNHPNGKIGQQCIRDIAAWHYLYLLGHGDIAND